MSTIKNVNINGTLSKLSASVYDVSEENDNRHFSGISEILANANTYIPENERFPGMQIKFIIDTEALFSVVRTDGLIEIPSGTALESTSTIQSGTYKESDLTTVFASLPQSTGFENSITYYFANTVDETTTYNTWKITMTKVSSSEYVYYRLMNAEWSIGLNDWAVESEDTLVENPEWVKVIIDSDGRVLFGIKVDGSIEWGAGVPAPVKEYIDSKIENDEVLALLDGLLGGDALETILNSKVDKIDGKSLIDVDFSESHYTVDNIEWLDVKTDNADKIIEGINVNGEKYISKFDNETEDMIKNLSRASEALSSVINIPILDTNFTSPVPYKVYNGDLEDITIKGQANAKYVFDVPLSEESFNIRCRVRITENLLNQMKTARMVKLGNVYIGAVPAALSQYSTTVTYDGSSHTMLWNDFKGGVKYNDGTGDTGTNKLAIGQYAFYIQYTGSESTASVENDGTKFILKIGSTRTEFGYSTYDTVSALYEAIKDVQDVTVVYKELEGRLSSELAIFPECQIKTTCYTETDRGFGSSGIQEYVDAYQFYIPYAVDDSWHQIEIVKIGDILYSSFDGILKKFQYNSSNDYSHLVLGDGNSMYFKDLYIDLESPNDAEYWQNGDRLVSSANPLIIIFEGHGIDDAPVVETADYTSAQKLATSTDRLYYVYERMRCMGYVPVSVFDIADYYARNTQLPKRCFTAVFDGERWENWLEIKYRKAFSELGIHPVIAAVTGDTSDVTYNVYGGTKTVTRKEAGELSIKNGFSIVSHTRDHWKTDAVRVSTLLDEFMQDIEAADNCLADGMILVYPGGQKTRASFAAMKWLGFRLGISIATASDSYVSNTLGKNRYNINRVEIGFRTNLETIFNKVF